MELRKVQLTGGSSLTVTLPKAWAEKVGLAAGDVVGFDEQPDGSLSVRPHVKGERAVDPYRIEAAGVEAEQLFRRIVSAYLMGHDAIRVAAGGDDGLSPKARRAVRDAVRRIVGLEVVEEGPDGVTLQDLLDPKDFHMDKALRRMAMLTRAMQEEAVQALHEADEEALRSVRDYDDEVDRLYWLVNKQFHALLRDASYAAKMGLTASQAMDMLLLARVVERTADHAARIAEKAVELERTEAAQRLADELAGQAGAATELFQAAMGTFVAGDADGAGRVIDEIDAFLPAQEGLIEAAARLGGQKVTHLAFIIESIGRTAAYAEDVAEVAINHEAASAGKGR